MSDKQIYCTYEVHVKLINKYTVEAYSQEEAVLGIETWVKKDLKRTMPGCWGFKILTEVHKIDRGDLTEIPEAIQKEVQDKLQKNK